MGTLLEERNQIMKKLKAVKYSKGKIGKIKVFKDSFPDFKNLKFRDAFPAGIVQNAFPNEGDSFETFNEWASEADKRAFGKL
jgi:hypothetical protein